MRKYLLAFIVLISLPAWSTVADRAEDIQPLGVNQEWPNAPLRQVDGKTTDARKMLDGAAAVVVFFRGGWCPYCNRHLSELRHIQDDLDSMGLQLIAISPDSPASLRAGLKETPLDYTLMSDSSAALIKALGIAFRVDAATREKYQGYGIDLEKASGESHFLLPVPAVYIVDKQGTIRYIYANPDYKTRLDNADLLAAARKIVAEEAGN